MEKKLKIALVLNRFYPEIGGAETNLYFQATHMAKKYDVTVFSPKRLSDEKAKDSINGFSIGRLKDFLNLKNKFPNIKMNTLMLGVFFKILFGKFDVVQAFPAMNYNNMLALIAAKIRGIPFVLCSFDLLDYAGMLSSFDRIDDDTFNSHLPSKNKCRLFSMCDCICAIANREIDFFKKYNKYVVFTPVPIQTAEYAAPCEIDVRKKYNVSKNDMLFFCVGRVSKIKGQDIAVKAFCKAAKKIPNAKLAIVGRTDYEPSFLEAMKEEIKKNNLEDRIFFTGSLDRPEVVAFLKQGDVHIIPVRFMNAGAVVVETWAAGNTLIQSDVVDPNLIIHGVNGYNFKSENVDDLAEKIELACANKDSLKQMAQVGKERVLKEFTYENLMDIYQKIYDKLV